MIFSGIFVQEMTSSFIFFTPPNSFLHSCNFRFHKLAKVHYFNFVFILNENSNSEMKTSCTGPISRSCSMHVQEQGWSKRICATYAHTFAKGKVRFKKTRKQANAHTYSDDSNCSSFFSSSRKESEKKAVYYSSLGKKASLGFVDVTLDKWPKQLWICLLVLCPIKRAEWNAFWIFRRVLFSFYTHLYYVVGIQFATKKGGWRSVLTRLCFCSI